MAGRTFCTQGIDSLDLSAVRAASRREAGASRAPSAREAWVSGDLSTYSFDPPGTLGFTDDFSTYDVDHSGTLSFTEFVALLRAREPRKHPVQELRLRFDFIDTDKSGTIDVDEYKRFALREALAAASENIVTLFSAWDEDGSGAISRREFRRAVRAFGPGPWGDEQIDDMFGEFDADGSGLLTLVEFERKLRMFAGLLAENKIPLRAASGGRWGAALGTSFSLREGDEEEMIAQLQQALHQSLVRVVDLFHDWDEDGDGFVSLTEFRQVLPLIGLHDVPRDRIDALFRSFDKDGSGKLEYREMYTALRARLNSGPGTPRTPGASGKASPRFRPPSHRTRDSEGASTGGRVPEPAPDPVYSLDDLYAVHMQPAGGYRRMKAGGWDDIVRTLAPNWPRDQRRKLVCKGKAAASLAESAANAAAAASFLREERDVMLPTPQDLQSGPLIKQARP